MPTNPQPTRRVETAMAAAVAAGMLYYFIITNYFRSPLQVEMAMAVVVVAATAPATQREQRGQQEGLESGRG